jgi:hypothetical protein
MTNPDTTIFPYDEELQPVAAEEAPQVHAYLWPYRELLWRRQESGVANMRELGRKWWEYSRFHVNRFRVPISIAYAEIATHNHFVLSRGGRAFSQTAPVVRLPLGTTERQYSAILGFLNSAVACFWLKQVSHAKAAGGIGRGLEPEQFMERYCFDTAKVKLLPVVKDVSKTAKYATRLDALARARSGRTVSLILARHGECSNSAELGGALQERRKLDLLDFRKMVALQEELDWLCYALYGLDENSDVIEPEAVESLLPTSLPWCIAFARRDAENRAAVERGEEPDELPSVWFERHGWEPQLEPSKALSTKTHARIAARLARTATVPALSLIESPKYKRRWYKPDYDAEEREALATWLADRVEEVAKARERVFILEQLVSALQGEPRVLAVCEVLTGRPDFNLSSLVMDTLFADSVPNHCFHVYKPSGLTKRAVWERTWEDQRREDAGEKVTPEVAPSYKPTDFLRDEYWKLRGKLDVPKERFIAFTEVPGRDAVDTLYGWAGWTPQQRAKAILAIDEDLEDAGIPVTDRIALLDSAWRLLPDVARDDAKVASRLKAELQALTTLEGPSKEMVDDWAKRFPPPGSRKQRQAPVDEPAKPKKARARKPKKTPEEN